MFLTLQWNGVMLQLPGGNFKKHLCEPSSLDTMISFACGGAGTLEIF